MTSYSIRRQRREGDATALIIFIGVSTNENTGRESEAPAELFRPRDRPRDRPQVLVDAKWPPNKAPQERRSPVHCYSHAFIAIHMAKMFTAVGSSPASQNRHFVG